MRYELGILQLLVGSAGKRRPARLDVVARALGISLQQLEAPLRYLRQRGFVDDQHQPTEAGVARARFIQRAADTLEAVQRQREGALPSRIPPSSGVFARDEVERARAQLERLKTG
ncbi:MAG: hypothetical protein AAF411_10815 [Myxococcota bacterium]